MPKVRRIGKKLSVPRDGIASHDFLRQARTASSHMSWIKDRRFAPVETNFFGN